MSVLLPTLNILCVIGGNKYMIYKSLWSYLLSYSDITNQQLVLYDQQFFQMINLSKS